jgi:hypothetical protein
MIKLTCWGCGWQGKVADAYGGRRVICKRCRTENSVPDSATREDFPVVWRDAIDPASRSETDEVDVRNWPHMWS